MYIIETKKLKHSFSKNVACLKSIDLKVPKGSIYGFLGKNGAGKTTTLKLILGLLEKQDGEIFLFNQELKRNRVPILKRVGSLIESPSFYGHLSAIENLSILQKIYQCPKKRIDEVIQIVGLTDSGNKKANQFSLGMKQRLSIGSALLHQPELLILDEPTNGLDPNGIIEIRALLKKINMELGTTIVVSSHLLSEIEILANHLAIINEGKILFQGKIEELKAKTNSTLCIETDNPYLSAKIIKQLDLKGSLSGNFNYVTGYTKSKTSELVKQLVSNNVAIYKVVEQEISLETIFINLTNN